MKQNDFDKIDHYVAGRADDKEKEYVENLFLDGESNLCLRNSLEKDWDSTLSDSSPSGAKLNYLHDRILNMIKRNGISERRKYLHKFLRIYIKIAAVLLLPLVVTGGLVYNYLSPNGKSPTDKQAKVSIYAPLGTRSFFKLPDGTNGVLNGGSKISYNLPFNGNRKVSLEGEAWLEVAHDEKHPFNILAGNSTIEVLGTSLNVSASPDENYVEVVLKEGKVSFNNPEGDGKVTMVPSEKLVFQNSKTTKSFVDPEKYKAWTEGKLIFRGDPMAEVALRISRWYNVKINLADKEIEQYSFRGTFQDDTLEDVLWCLCLTSPIRYTINPRKFMADGTFKKEEVTIYMRK